MAASSSSACRAQAPMREAQNLDSDMLIGVSVRLRLAGGETDALRAAQLGFIDDPDEEP